jgi:hypothetical protein
MRSSFVNLACRLGEFSSNAAALSLSLSLIGLRKDFFGKGVSAIDDTQKCMSPYVVLICEYAVRWWWGMSIGMIADDGRRLHLSAAVLVQAAFFRASQQLLVIPGKNVEDREVVGCGCRHSAVVEHGLGRKYHHANRVICL